MENIETEVDNMNNSVNIDSGITNDINMNSADSNETTKSVNNISNLNNTGSLDNTPSIAVNEASAFQENNSNGTSNICKKRNSSDIGVVKSTNLLKGNAFSSLLAYGGDSSSGDTDDDDDNDEDIIEIRNEDQNNKMQVDKTISVLSSGQQFLATATNVVSNVGNVSSEPQTSNAVNNNNPIETNDKNQNDDIQIIYHNNNNKNTGEKSPISNRTNTSDIRNNNTAFTRTQIAAVNDDDDDTSSLSSSSSSTSIAFSEDIDFSVDGSDEETDDDEDNGETTGAARKKKPNNRKNMTTEGELSLDDLPPIKDLHVSVPQDQCVLLGNILNIVDKLVVVQALKDLPALDLDTVLFLEWNKPLGQVFDVFGPVIEPLYCVRFNSTDHIQTKDISVGLPVYFVPKSNHTRYVFLAQLMRLKGSDASWEDNNEPPREYLEYSDDEQERKANKILRRAGIFKKEVVKEEEDASGPQKKRPTAYEQRMNERNLRISEIQKRRSQNRRSWNSQNQLIRSPNFMPPLPPCDYSASPTSSQSSSDNQPLFDFRSSFANNPPSPHNIMSDCRPKCLPSFGQNKHVSLPPSPGFLRSPPPVPPQHLFQTSLSPWGPGSNIPVPPPATHPGLFSPSIAGSNNISTGLRPNPPTNQTLGQSSHPFFPPPNFSQNREPFLASFQSPPPPLPPPTISPHCQPNPFSTPPPTFTQTSTSFNTFSLPPLPSIPNASGVFSSPPPRIPYNSNEFPNLPPPPQFPQPVNVLPGFPNQNQPTFQNNFNRPSNPTPPNCRY